MRRKEERSKQGQTTTRQSNTVHLYTIQPEDVSQYKDSYTLYKPLRLLYSLIIYEIVNFSFFTLYSLLLLSFFLYLKSVPIYVIVHVLLYWEWAPLQTLLNIHVRT